MLGDYVKFRRSNILFVLLCPVLIVCFQNCSRVGAPSSSSEQPSVLRSSQGQGSGSEVGGDGYGGKVYVEIAPNGCSDGSAHASEIQMINETQGYLVRDNCQALANPVLVTVQYNPSNPGEIIFDGRVYFLYTQMNADDGPYELGVKFTASQPGTIKSIRYYKAKDEGGSHTGHIWTANGQLLATANFSNEGSTGWQEAQLSSPLSIQSGSVYIVSVNSNSNYVGTQGVFASSVRNGPLSTVADGKNGVYGAPRKFPTQTYANANYYRDIVFQPAGATSSSYSIFASHLPTIPAVGGTYELGSKYVAKQNGQIVSVRYYKSMIETGTHVGNIWSSSGKKLASIQFVNETAFGWQEVILSEPISISAGKSFVVSVNCNVAYVATNQQLPASSAAGLKAVDDGANGVFSEQMGKYPMLTYENTDYFRDAGFRTSP